MKRPLRHVVLVTIVLSLAGFASARDFHLRLFAPLVTSITDQLPTASLGDDLHAAQEAVHGLVTRTTGLRVPHSYIWLHLGKTSIPIDPINFSK